jgi:hypothetical protein
MAEIMGYPLGMCESHGPKLAVNGVPTCIKCKAKEDNANRVMVVSKVQDPGEEYFKSGKVNPQVAVAQSKVAVVTQSAGYTLESGLQEILNVLAQIPMPSSMKQYKLLLHVKQKIEAAIQEG